MLDLVIRFGEMLPIAFSALGLDGRSAWANEAYCDLVGLTLEAMMARRVEEAVHPDDMPRYDAVIDRVKAGETVEVDLRTLHRTGRWLDVRWGMRYDPDTDLVYAIGLNVTEDRRARSALRHEADHDSLTGAANRSLVMRTLAGWQAEGLAVAVGIVDLDDFKQVNDRMGHRVGDAMLRVLVQRLAAAVAPAGLVGRMGGDEFVVLVPSVDQADLDQLRRRLGEVSGSVTVQGRRLLLSASIGLTVGSAADPDQLMHEADVAVYVAKGNGKGHVQFFDETLRQDGVRRATVERRLIDALDGGGFELQLQPIIALAEDVVVGAEALARLPGPEGLLEAAHFVDVAKGLGVMAAVSQRIRGIALRAANDLPAPVALHLNLDSEDLMGLGGLGAIVDMATAHDVAPDRLVLELTEGTLLRDREMAARELRTVRAKGVRVAIDDFGAGTSSLSRISSLPVDILKVDRSLLTAARTGPAAHAVLAAVASMGPALGVDVVLQGIESPADLQIARDLGVTAVQGWLLGVPMSVPKLTDHLATHHS